ncbi:dienelactone hydrolase family protein [Nonomuraea muscovyensis]|uniref:Dienelactone hydrolase n=1 Tax=Nonomuraea muscovyensis TaxID=1124761 RepID=A0A7X0EV94_9ACTN|nr:dienelactone hydrolase family protein [Nonomuraea muscovyensis]MBB6345288.1 dienelactone hydrolase [Nonomuraea muscovyensis]
MTVVEESLRVPVADAVLDADVATPARPRGVVMFAHGSGSGRHSPRNRYVAACLQAAGLATVLADLLTPAEERIDTVSRELRFDIGLLSDRMTELVDWAGGVDWLPAGTPGGDAPDGRPAIGLFGASTGAAAALVTAARRPSEVRAVVSRGGRPDLACAVLPEVRQPTLLVVGGNDTVVIELNRQALRLLAGEARMEIVPGASHLFEEKGALEEVARLACDWFLTRL